MKENELVVLDKIIDVSTRLIVNRSIMKTRPNDVKSIIAKFRGVTDGCVN